MIQVTQETRVPLARSGIQFPERKRVFTVARARGAQYDVLVSIVVSTKYSDLYSCLSDLSFFCSQTRRDSEAHRFEGVTAISGWIAEKTDTLLPREEARRDRATGSKPVIPQVYWDMPVREAGFGIRSSVDEF